jgi:hypothetical protein
MANEIRVTTTGTQDPVVIVDFGAYEIDHPTSAFNILSDGFSLEEVRDSADFQGAIDAGEITVTDENGTSITNVKESVSADAKVKVSSDDDNTDFLANKLVGTTNKITATVLNGGGDESIQLGIGSDVFDKNTDDTDDITEGSTNEFYTEAKVSANTDVAANTTHRTNTGNPHSTSVTNLSDTTITSLTTGEILVKSAGDWINQTLAEAGIAAASHTHAASDVTSGTFADARIAETNVTQHEAAIDHDALTNYAAGEHRIINDAGTSATELWSASKIDSELGDKLETSLKGANNGLAELDAGGKVPTAQLPDSVVGAMDYKGVWNATTNTPTLGNSGAGGVQGDYYVVSVAGTTSIDGEADWQIGDWIVNNGTTWDKIDNTDKVSSVNGQTGAVSLDTDDITEGTTNEYYTEAKVSANTDVAANTTHRTNTGNPHSTSISNLDDTTLTALADGEVLVSSSGNWINQTLAEAGIAAASHTHAASDVTSGTFADARIAESNVTQHEGAIDHDALTNYVANEHIDWTTDQGATNINDNNVPHTGVTTGNPHSVTKTDVGLSNVENLKVNLSGTAAPTVNDDVDLGYTVGSRWFDTTNDKEYVCLDNTDGAAVWTETTQTGSGGEANTASNVGTAGVGVFKQKAGDDLEFKNINAGSNKISITDDTGDDEIDIDVNEGNIDHDSLSGYVANEHIDWTSDQGATNIHDNNVPHTSVTTGNPHSVTKTDVGLSNVENTKVNLTATDAPDANDDSGSGYSVGSIWIDVTNDKAYVCVDATSTAAVWQKVSDDNLITFSASRNNANVNSVYLRAEDGTPTNLAKFPVLYDSTIVGLAASCSTAANAWTAEIRNNAASSIATISLTNVQVQKQDTTLSVNVNAGEWLSIYLDKNPGGGGSGTNISYPKVTAFLKRR